MRRTRTPFGFFSVLSHAQVDGTYGRRHEHVFRGQDGIQGSQDEKIRSVSRRLSAALPSGKEQPIRTQIAEGTLRYDAAAKELVGEGARHVKVCRDD